MSAAANVVDLTGGDYDEQVALEAAMKASMEVPVVAEEDDELAMALKLSAEEALHATQRNRWTENCDTEEFKTLLQLSADDQQEESAVFDAYAAEMEAAIAASLEESQKNSQAATPSLLRRPSVHAKSANNDDWVLNLPGDLQVMKSLRQNFELELGVRLDFLSIGGVNKLRIVHTDPDVCAVAMIHLQECINQPAVLTAKLNTLKNERLHVFIDHSNIFLGAQMIIHRAGGSGRNSVRRDPHVRVKDIALAGLIEGGRTCVEKLVFGSVPTGGSQLWSGWERLGYTVHTTQRAAGMGEQFVDDAIIAQINNVILKFHTPPNPQHTLVLLTGDGNDNHGRATFLDCVDKALLRGWKVELWTWRACTSRKYLDMLAHYGKDGVFQINYLDIYRDSVTFTAPHK